MTAKSFYALEFRELNAIRWQSEKSGGVYSFRVTESGLIPVETDDPRCDLSIGRTALYIHTDTPARNPVRRPSGAPHLPDGDLFRLLAPLPEFEALDDQELRQLAAQAIRRDYAAGKCLVREGDHGDSLFVLAEGHVRVFAGDDEANGQPRAELGAGSCIGEMSLLTGTPRSATVRAVTDCVAYEIRKEHLRDLLEQNAQWVERLSSLMAERQIAQAQRERLRASQAEQTTLARAFAEKLKSCFGLT